MVGAVFLGLCGAARAADALATVTIVDGASTLLRDGGKFIAAEGVRLAAGDILQSGPQARLLRVEFQDGAVADLGPDSRVLIAPRLTSAGRKPTRLYLLQGWLKFAAPATPSAGGAGGAWAGATLLTPGAELVDVSRQVVVAVLPDSSQVFSESGTVGVADRQATPAAAVVKLKAGEFYARMGKDKAAVSPRPSAAFIQAVPRTFLDTLPSRAALFKSADVAPKKVGDMAYADAAGWLGGEALLRPYFVSAWRALAKRPDFRAGLVDNMRLHPEWDRILFPEKYAPKPQATPSAPRPAGA